MYTIRMETTKRVKYYRHKIENLLRISKIVTIHYFEFDKNFSSEGETHNFWEMVYADSGEVICLADDQTIVLKEGEAIFHRPGEFHRLSSNGKWAPNVFVASFECTSEAMRFFEKRRMKIPKELRKYIYGIYEEASATFQIPLSDPASKKMELLPSPALGGKQMLKNQLEMLLIALMRSESGKDTESRFLRFDEVGDSIASRILTVLEENLTKGLSVDEICAGIAYSRSYIFKQFKASTGKTIADCYNRMKIEYARRLIRENKHSFSEIAELLHFDSSNYFCKTFKRYTGVTPKDYRARYRKE